MRASARHNPIAWIAPAFQRPIRASRITPGLRPTVDGESGPAQPWPPNAFFYARIPRPPDPLPAPAADCTAASVNAPEPARTEGRTSAGNHPAFERRAWILRERTSPPVRHRAGSAPMHSALHCPGRSGDHAEFASRMRVAPEPGRMGAQPCRTVLPQTSVQPSGEAPAWTSTLWPAKGTCSPARNWRQGDPISAMSTLPNCFCFVTIM